MRSMLFRRLLPALLCLPLLSTACATSSTPASLRRAERPTLPTLSPELTRTEHLAPIAPVPTGQLMTIDRGWLDALTTGYASAIGAVERLNDRMFGIKAERRCTAAILATGTPPAGCPKAAR